jgi:flavin-dependent dehydrogenase
VGRGSTRINTELVADVIVAGAGPAGSIAATVLARAGARVLLIERGRFPRPKLCGDSINPGAAAILHRLGLFQVLAGGLPVDGMLVSGEGAVRVVGTYPNAVRGVSLTRAVLDARLAAAAVQAGARLEESAVVRGPLLNDGRVRGVEVSGGRGPARQVFAPVVIAADGHFSRVARPLQLSRAAARPRRWAIGAYFEGVHDLGEHGEMHVRRDHYIGVAPVPGGLANACLVSARRSLLRNRAALIGHLAADPVLRDRFADARMVGQPTVLGPLAIDSPAAGYPGLLLAGDAAGFIDPMTGDGLRFAFRGGELAALEALRVLEYGWNDSHRRLQRSRRAEFGRKWRFNRALRAVAARPLAVRAASVAARVAPGAVRRVIAYAGDI